MNPTTPQPRTTHPVLVFKEEYNHNMRLVGNLSLEMSKKRAGLVQTLAQVNRGGLHQ